jgi:hypothetical protein
MTLSQKIVVGASLAAAFLAIPATVGSAPANASVWDCYADVNTGENFATASCQSGFGYYRVRAECNSGSWPYTKTIYGPWIYRSSGQGGSPPSNAYGDPAACHVARASYETM